MQTEKTRWKNRRKKQSLTTEKLTERIRKIKSLTTEEIYNTDIKNLIVKNYRKTNNYPEKT